MVVFGLHNKDNPIIDKVMLEIKDRGANVNPIANPFRIRITSFKFGWVVSILPLYPNYSIFGWLVALGVYMIWGFNWLVTIGIIIGCLGIFWTKYFYMLMLRLSLRKNGYKDKIKFITSDEILEGWFL